MKKAKATATVIIEVLAVVFVIVVIIAAFATGTKYSTKKELEFRFAPVLEIPEEKLYYDVYTSYAAGLIYMDEAQYKALEAFAELKPEMFQKMESPFPVRAKGKAPVIVYTDDQGVVKVTDGETVWTFGQIPGWATWRRCAATSVASKEAAASLYRLYLKGEISVTQEEELACKGAIREPSVADIVGSGKDLFPVKIDGEPLCHLVYTSEEKTVRMTDGISSEVIDRLENAS